MTGPAAVIRYDMAFTRFLAVVRQHRPLRGLKQRQIAHCVRSRRSNQPVDSAEAVKTRWFAWTKPRLCYRCLFKDLSEQRYAIHTGWSRKPSEGLAGNTSAEPPVRLAGPWYLRSSSRAIWFLCTSSGPSANRSTRTVAYA